ncbi:DUF6624 domain-containing protein [Chryseobacterium sp. M5A1_1a]
MNHQFEKEIIELADLDFSVRDKLLASGALSGGYHPEMEKVHKANAKRLREIISEIGFPTISKVGEMASDAAWLVIQHSIGEPEFMKECLTMMDENIDDINPKNRAYLYDRIQMFQGKPQKYGTQLTADGTPYPVQDKARLNEERTMVNLLQLSKEAINRISEPEDIVKLDNEDKEYTDWKKRVGWI